MQVTENSIDGLKRNYSVVITAADMERRLDGKLKTVSQSISMPGFRPGKVPPSLVKKIHGKSVIGEVLDEAVRESTEQLLKEKELRPAVQPKIEIKEYQEGADLSYEIAFEVLPDISLPDFSKIELERWVADIPDTKIQEVLDHLASQNKSFEDKEAGAAAESGDAIVIDFTGIVDGDAFEGGTAKGHQLELGSQSFLPGFEDQLMGVKAGKQGRPRGTAARAVVELAESDAPLGQAVEVRRGDLRAVAADVREAHVVGHNQDDVGPSGLSGRGGPAQKPPGRQRGRWRRASARCPMSLR